MSKKIAINGFGRIGRLALRRILESNSDLEVVAINDLTDDSDLAYLLKYDTAQGRFPYSVEEGDNALIVDGKEIKSYSEKDANNLPWEDLGIDFVLECTGFYTTKDSASAHINAGARKVLISAPVKSAEDDPVKTIVYGVNHDILDGDDQVVSAASCTTNCLAPVVDVLHKEFGVARALMSTIHAYTATQNLQDGPGGRKSRAGAQNAIPASTGAAKAVGKVIPELEGKIDGTAVRVPTITGSMTEVYAVLDKEVTADQVNQAMKNASSDAFDYNEDQIVSSDIIGYPYGSVFDATQTKIMDANDGQLVKVVSWYDNEYGFTANMVRTLEHFANL